MTSSVRVVHVYDREPHKFEADLNAALEKIVSEGGLVGDIKYASDAATSADKHGGFGALIIYETESGS